MNTFTSRTVLALMTLCLIMIGGCKTDQPGVTNRVGTIKATLAANPASVTEAAKEVLDEMDLIIISSNATAIDGRVVARTAQDVKVRVDSESVGENVSEVFIRVGTMGDKELSMTILDEVKEELGIATSDDDEDEAGDVDDDDDDKDND